MRFHSIESAFSRLGFLITGRGGARRDGYWDYAPLYARNGQADPAATRQKLLDNKNLVFFSNPSAQFPAFDALVPVLRGLPRETAVVLVRTPVYENALPRPGTPGDYTQKECAKAIDGLAAQFPNVRIIDLLTHGPVSADTANFYDIQHHRAPVATMIEGMIVKQLGHWHGMRPASPN